MATVFDRKILLFLIIAAFIVVALLMTFVVGEGLHLIPFHQLAGIDPGTLITYKK